MDFFEGVVIDYLRADRRAFVNTQCCIQLNEADNPDQSGPHWYCDALTVRPADSEVFLAEVSYAKNLDTLKTRLKAWNENWSQLKHAISRDSGVPPDWSVRVWLFVPESKIEKLVGFCQQLDASQGDGMPDPRITPLEMVQPWNYRSWNRKGEQQKPDSIPLSMQ